MFFNQHHRRTVAQWKREQSTQTESECNGRRAAHHIGLVHLQNVARKQIAHGEHIAVKVHRAFGFAGGAAGESDQTHIVTAGGVCGELRAAFGHVGFKPITGVTGKGHDLFQLWRVMGVCAIYAVFQFVAQMVGAQRGCDLRFVDDGFQLCSAQ